MRHPDAHKAFMLTSLPCNPLPFLSELTERILEHGPDYIKSDEGKAILWVINSMAYNQLATIDMSDEWVRLRMEIDPKPPVKETVG
jgi:hypothetical protein